eukprot:UC1_evm2s460
MNENIHDAARQGHHVALLNLLKNDADKDKTDMNGQAPLHIAAWRRQRQGDAEWLDAGFFCVAEGPHGMR